MTRHDKIIFMQPSLEKLRKYFRLERDNGYNNTTIIGGLSKMLEYWEGDARADSLNEEVIQAVVQRLRSYDGLTPQSRADALIGLWKRIADTYPEAGQKPAGPPPPRPRTAPQVAPAPQPQPERSPATLPLGRADSARVQGQVPRLWLSTPL